MAPRSKPNEYKPPTEPKDFKNTIRPVVPTAIERMINDYQIDTPDSINPTSNNPVTPPLKPASKGQSMMAASAPDVPTGRTIFTSSYNPALDLNHGKKLTVDETAALLAYSYFNMNAGFFSTDRETRGSLSDKNLSDLMSATDNAHSDGHSKVDTNQAAASALQRLPDDMAARWRAVAALIPENLRYDNKGSGKRVGPLLTLDVRGVMQRALQEYKTANPTDTEQIDKWQSEIDDVTGVLVGTATINLQEAGYPLDDPTVTAQINRLSKQPTISFDLSQVAIDLPDIEKNKAFRRANPILPDGDANPIITADGKVVGAKKNSTPGFAEIRSSNMNLASLYQRELSYGTERIKALLTAADPTGLTNSTVADDYVVSQFSANAVSGSAANSGPAFAERMQLSPNEMMSALRDRTPKEIMLIENNLRAGGYYELAQGAPTGGFNNLNGGLGSYDPSTIKAYAYMIADAVQMNKPIDKLIPEQAERYKNELASQGRKEFWDDQGRANYIEDGSGSLVLVEYVNGQPIPKGIEFSNPAAIIYTANAKAQSLLDRDLAPNEAQYIIDAVHRAETTHAAEVVTAQVQGFNTTAFDPNYIIEQYLQVMGGSGRSTGDRLYGDALTAATFGTAPNAPAVADSMITAPPPTNSSSMMPAESATMPTTLTARSRVRF